LAIALKNNINAPSRNSEYDSKYEDEYHPSSWSRADGSSWSKVITTLENAGYHIVAAQLPENSLADGIAACS
jgi:hypothetical protein